MTSGSGPSSASEVSVGQDPARCTLGHFLTDLAARHGEREALVFEGRRIRYGELHAEAVQLARCLVGAGVVKGARVAVLMANRPEWVTAAFAVGMIGGVFVPLNTFATPRERDHMLRHSDSTLLLMQPSLLRRSYADELIEGHPEIGDAAPGQIRCRALPQLRSVFALEPELSRGGIQSWKELQQQGDGVSEELVLELCSEVHPSDPGVMIYTSGSTALPKGVLHRQRAPVIQSWRFAEQLLLQPEDRVWSAQPLFWSAGFCMTLGATLASGATLLMQETFEAGRALEILESERATVAHAWAHQQEALGSHPSAHERDLSSLRKVNADSPLFELAGLSQNVWGPEGSYGLSETFTICSSIPSDAPLAQRRETSGRPLPGMTFRICDPHTGEPVEPGAPGEITVKGVNLMLGYHKVDPESALDADGYFHTSDGGWLDDAGSLHWSGRIGDLIKTAGANVSPREIEQALAPYHVLKAAQVVGVPHPTLGEAIILCAVLAEGASPDEDAVREYLRDKIAGYKLPRRTLFFDEAELELTGNQKIRVEPLRQAALQRLEAEGSEIAGHRYAPNDA